MWNEVFSALTCLPRLSPLSELWCKRTYLMHNREHAHSMTAFMWTFSSYTLSRWDIKSHEKKHHSINPTKEIQPWYRTLVQPTNNLGQGHLLLSQGALSNVALDICWDGMATACLCSLSMYLEGCKSLLKSAPGQSVSSRAWASSSLCISQVLLVLLQCGHLGGKQTKMLAFQSIRRPESTPLPPAPIQCRSNDFQS